jgi:hypothetical protein
MLCLVALVRTDVSEKISASFIRVTRIDELGTTLAVTSNRRRMCDYTQVPTAEAMKPSVCWNIRGKNFDFSLEELNACQRSSVASYC